MVKAAAKEFDRNGYEGTSLARVSRSANISIGALTFHFASKGDLADAVLAQGLLEARAVIECVRASKTPALESVIELTLSLVRLLEEDDSVRAAARLTRERTDFARDWSFEWAPFMAELVAQGQWDDLRPSADPKVVTALADYLITGAEVQVRRRVQAQTSECPRESSQAQLAEIWDMALCRKGNQRFPYRPRSDSGTADAAPRTGQPGLGPEPVT
ncbi:TetR/AcrR family transcriptional regulator [Streptomyces sp. H27-C3]|uniref:TetR/AcrR family transcriptional regulator n=1 Tax=Streptomyces sp. H27-C3 TaxID=3046305 RepID=UPI0024BB6D00|nr:TetR/AcrR family transcriptional regulator [Streptomyces sp. H27-C3]MDJ0466754.1 TetR/AcrR family transcriptional regulator [Streptomyces sp. H27-C3]